MPFPLRLAPFEEYMLHDDRPEHPMCHFYRLRFTGELDQTRLEESLTRVLARHPLLTANVQRIGRRLFWRAAEEQVPEIEWRSQASAESLPTTDRIDLFQDAGLRLIVVKADQATDLVFQFHHATCDGKGACQVIEELLADYAGVDLPASPDLQLLRRRAGFGLTAAQLLRLAPRQMIGLLGARQFLMRKPVRVAPREEALVPPQSSGWPAIQTRSCDPLQTRSLMAAARAQGTTLNTLLARDLFLVLSRWRTQSNMAGEREWLRFLVPMNLRGQSASAISAANFMSYVFLDRQVPQPCDPAALLASIHDEMSLIQRNQLGYTFAFSLRAARGLGRFEQRVRQDERCRSTCVFSNLGVLFPNSALPREDGKILVGGAILDSVEFVTPIRRHTHAGFAASTYAGRLSVTLQYDPHFLSAADANCLLDHLEACWNEDLLRFGHTP